MALTQGPRLANPISRQTHLVLFLEAPVDGCDLLIRAQERNFAIIRPVISLCGHESFYEAKK